MARQKQETSGGSQLDGILPRHSPAAGHPDAYEMVRAVGASIRAARKRRRLTLQELAERTGVSVSMLSMLERGVASPSIGTLVSVSSALGLHMAQLFQDPAAQPPSPVRRLADQVIVQAGEGVSRRLVHTDLDIDLEMVVNEYEPGTSSASAPVHHDGREFGLIISGVLTVQLGGIDYVLDTGDGISYESTTPHVLTNHGPVKARAVWINVGFGENGQAEPGQAS
jgi:transcriptional regulator with XRE-family HTH domain